MNLYLLLSWCSSSESERLFLKQTLSFNFGPFNVLELAKHSALLCCMLSFLLYLAMFFLQCFSFPYEFLLAGSLTSIYLLTVHWRQCKPFLLFSLKFLQLLSITWFQSHFRILKYLIYQHQLRGIKIDLSQRSTREARPKENKYSEIYCDGLAYVIVGIG